MVQTESLLSIVCNGSSDSCSLSSANCRLSSELVLISRNLAPPMENERKRQFLRQRPQSLGSEVHVMARSYLLTVQACQDNLILILVNLNGGLLYEDFITVRSQDEVE